MRQFSSEPIPGLQAGDDVQVYNGVPYILRRDEQGNLRGEVLPGFERPDEVVEPVTIGKGDRLVNPVTGEIIVDVAEGDIEMNEELSVKDLKDLGQDGWELVQLINKRKGKITAILKKEN